jgi:hypothetical protein
MQRQGVPVSFSMTTAVDPSIRVERAALRQQAWES